MLVVKTGCGQQLASERLRWEWLAGNREDEGRKEVISIGADALYIQNTSLRGPDQLAQLNPVDPSHATAHSLFSPNAHTVLFLLVLKQKQQSIHDLTLGCVCIQPVNDKFAPQSPDLGQHRAWRHYD